MTDLSTTTYGWVKPTAGADRDTWGGLLNTDLDGIDSTVSGVASSLSSTRVSLSQVSSSLSGAISSTTSLSTGVSSSLSGHTVSLSQMSSSLSGAISSTTSLSTGVSSSLSSTNSTATAISSSLSGAISSTTSLSTGVSSSLSANASTALSSTTSLSTAIAFPMASGGNKADTATFVIGDANKFFAFSASAATVSIPANASVAFAVGTLLEIHNTTGGNCTLAITTDTLRSHLGSGSRTVGSSGSNMGVIAVRKTAATVWDVVYGFNLT